MFIVRVDVSRYIFALTFACVDKCVRCAWVSICVLCSRALTYGCHVLVLGHIRVQCAFVDRYASCSRLFDIGRIMFACVGRCCMWVCSRYACLYLCGLKWRALIYTSHRLNKIFERVCFWWYFHEFVCLVFITKQYKCIFMIPYKFGWVTVYVGKLLYVSVDSYIYTCIFVCTLCIFISIATGIGCLIVGRCVCFMYNFHIWTHRCIH